MDGLVAAHLANHGEDVIDLKAFRYMLAQGRVVLLFDGFDELATRVTYDRAADHLQTLLAAAEGKAKIVVASRTQHFKSRGQVLTALGERVELLPNRRVLEVEDFDTEQIRAYLGNAIGEQQAADERLALISGDRRPARAVRQPPDAQLHRGARRRPAARRGGRGQTLRPPSCTGRSSTPGSATSSSAPGPRPARPPGLSAADLRRGVTVLALRMAESGEAFISPAELAEEARRSPAWPAGALRGAGRARHRLGLAAGARRRRHVRVHPRLGGRVAGRQRDRRPAGAAPRRPASRRSPARRPGRLPAGLLGRRLSQLTIDFLCDLADPAALEAWAARVLGDADAANAARANALRVSARMRIPARTDLRGAVLRGEDLSHREFGGVDFTGADLTRARFVGANLAGAVLRGARLAGARLDGARLAGADLRGADLSGARLFRADLSGAQTEGSRWNRAAVIGASGLDDPGAAGGCAARRSPPGSRSRRSWPRPRSASPTDCTTSGPAAAAARLHRGRQPARGRQRGRRRAAVRHRHRAPGPHAAGAPRPGLRGGGGRPGARDGRATAPSACGTPRPAPARR